MRTTTKLHLGAILSVLIRTPEEMAPIAIEAGVVRHEERNLVGIEFLKVGKIDKERLLQYIHKIHQQKENPLTDLDLQRDLPDQGNTPLKAEEYRVQPNRLPKRAAGELNP